MVFGFSAENSCRSMKLITSILILSLSRKFLLFGIAINAFAVARLSTFLEIPVYLLSVEIHLYFLRILPLTIFAIALPERTYRPGYKQTIPQPKYNSLVMHSTKICPVSDNQIVTVVFTLSYNNDQIYAGYFFL